MTELTYEALLEQLFPRLTGGIRWGLERTEQLLATVGDPHTAYPSIHIGGTNGKGSVAAMVESVLRRRGLRTGLYTSPHLVDFRERIRVDGRMIAEADLLASARALWPAVAAQQPSFFEAATAIAFLALREAEVDVAVVEVGMGGRLDSTNVVRPEVSVITNVALDHAQYLGRDVVTIAGEKAGIIKAGVPVVTGETDPEVLEVLRFRAREQNAALHEVAPGSVRVDARGTTAVVPTRDGDVRLQVPLPGRHQGINLAVAVRALELVPDPLRPTATELADGLAATRWPGRVQLEQVGETHWIFDVAHNAAGVESLLGALHEVQPARPLVALIGVLGDKQWDRMLPPMLDYADSAVLTEPPSAPAERRWDPEAVLESLGDRYRARVVRPFASAVREAASAAGAGTVLCTGSVHTVGDAMTVLGLAPFAAQAGLQPDAAAG